MISRRGFVRMVGGSVLIGSSGLQLVLQACSSPAPPTSTAAAGAGSSAKSKALGSLPTYIAPKLPTQPDYHSPDPRITDGYDTFPKTPFKSWTKPAPGAGGRVDVFIVAYYPQPTLFENNPTWQEINKQLNANVQMSTVRGSDYPVKIGTVMASGDLPDIVHVYNGIGAAPNMPDFFKAQCADLTPYLAGDAVKDYPNLAAIPSYAWTNSQCIIDGKLFQWPIHRYLPLAGLQGQLHLPGADGRRAHTVVFHERGPT